MIRFAHNLRIRILCWSLNRRVRKFQAKLQRMVDERRESFETEQFRRRRKAALRHEPRSWA